MLKSSPKPGVWATCLKSPLQAPCNRFSSHIRRSDPCFLGSGYLLVPQVDAPVVTQNSGRLRERDDTHRALPSTSESFVESRSKDVPLLILCLLSWTSRRVHE